MAPEQVPDFLKYLSPEAESQSGPWYFTLANQVRTQLQVDQTHALKTPELTQVDSLSDLFTHLSTVAETEWEQAMSAVMDTAFAAYIPKTQSGRDFIASLSDKPSIFQSLANNRNWQFENLRKAGDPEIWYSLFLALSQREQYKAKLLNEWVAKAGPSQEARWGISRHELQLYAGLNYELQPHLDQIYLKQMQISDSGLPWSKNPAKYANLAGSANFYIIDTNGTESIYTYEEVFPEEIASLKLVFAKYAQFIAEGVSTQELGAAYQAYPDYLRALAASFSVGQEYRSSPDDLSHIAAMFQAAYDAGNSVEVLCAALAQSGCLITINPSGFIGETSERVDMEMLIGVTLGSSSAWYQDGQALSQLTAELLRDRNLPADSLVPILHQLFLSVNGSNITYTSLASVGSFINFNDGRHLEVARDRHARYRSLVKASMEEKQFIQAIAISTMTHELGHLVMFLDGDINLKLGASIYINKLEELKADLVGAHLFQELLKTGQANLPSGQYLEQFLLNYLDDILDAPNDPSVDISPAWYAFDIKAILLLLFEAKALDFADGQFAIIDADLGLAVLADFGMRILDFYQDPLVGPAQVQTFVTNLEGRAETNSQYQQFLRKLKLEYA